MNFLLGWPIFRGELLVSGRVLYWIPGKLVKSFLVFEVIFFQSTPTGDTVDG